MPASREVREGSEKAQLGEASSEELSSEQRRTMGAGKPQCLGTGSCAAETSQVLERMASSGNSPLPGAGFQSEGSHI